MRQMFRRAGWPLLLSLAAGCGGANVVGNRILATRNRMMASHLGTGTDRAPHGEGLPVDLTKITFVDLQTSKKINLADYMQAQDRNYVMLVFGSLACDTCNEEAVRLRDQVLTPPAHLFLTEPGKHFEIVGVNIDPAGTHGVQQHSKVFPFIKWQDPSAQLMSTYFLPKGQPLKVPLTAMVDRLGTVHWEILPDDAAHISTADLIDRVDVTLGIAGGTGSGSVTGTGGGTGDDTGSGTGTGGGTGGTTGDAAGGTTGGDTGGSTGPDVPGLDLAEVGPGRFKNVPVTTCTGTATTLDTVLGEPAWRFVQVTEGACGAACQANMQQLAALSCRKATGAGACAVAALDTTAPAAADCSSGIAYAGGEAFYSVFQTFFNWSYPVKDGDVLSLPPVQGPLVFAFDQNGRLVYAQEGQLPAGTLAALPGQDAAPPRGPDFQMFDDKGQHGFADDRMSASYTVLTTWGELCSSCIEELKHWSAAGQLVDFCKARPGDCQILALDIDQPPTGFSLQQTYDRVLNGATADPHDRWTGLVKMGITTPPVLDPVNYNDYLHRIFEGYISALEPDWQGEPGALIYDREGKVMAAFKSASPPATGDDEVLAKLKQLLGVSK